MLLRIPSSFRCADQTRSVLVHAPSQYTCSRSTSAFLSPQFSQTSHSIIACVARPPLRIAAESEPCARRAGTVDTPSTLDPQLNEFEQHSARIARTRLGTGPDEAHSRRSTRHLPASPE